MNCLLHRAVCGQRQDGQAIKNKKPTKITEQADNFFFYNQISSFSSNNSFNAFNPQHSHSLCFAQGGLRSKARRSGNQDQKADQDNRTSGNAFNPQHSHSLCLNVSFVGPVPSACALPKGVAGFSFDSFVGPVPSACALPISTKASLGCGRVEIVIKSNQKTHAVLMKPGQVEHFLEVRIRDAEAAFLRNLDELERVQVEPLKQLPSNNRMPIGVNFVPWWHQFALKFQCCHTIK